MTTKTLYAGRSNAFRALPYTETHPVAPDSRNRPDRERRAWKRDWFLTRHPLLLQLLTVVLAPLAVLAAVAAVTAAVTLPAALLFGWL